MRNIGIFLLRYRKRHRVSCNKLAADLGIRRQHLYKIENLKRVPSTELLERIADHIGLEIVFQPKPKKQQGMHPIALAFKYMVNGTKSVEDSNGPLNEGLNEGLRPVAEPLRRCHDSEFLR